MKALIAIVSLVGGIIALVLFIYFYRKTGDLSLARSIAFATLGTNSLVYVFSIRTLRDSFWEENPFDNVWLDLAVVSGLLFQIAPFYITPLRQFLGLVPLSLMHWLIIFSVSILMFIIIEVSKEIFRIEHIE